MRSAVLLARNRRNLQSRLRGALRTKNLIVVARHAADRYKGEPWVASESRSLTPRQCADQSLDWICYAQDRVSSGGVGSYAFSGWSTGYPEVTGYIIPTMWDYAKVLGREDLARRARWMADWELSVQQECGGWEGGNQGDGLPPTVFNTGQVIRGLIRTYEETGAATYLEAALRGARWIVASQQPDGSWSTSNYLGIKRVYDTYVAAPLARLSVLTGDGRFAQAARENCEFALTQQHPNGWFSLCDNSPFYNDAPVTHTVCYTADGLFETGELLGEPRYIDAATVTATALAVHPRRSGYLPGRFDQRWAPTVRWCCVTGAAQLGVLLIRLYRRTGERDKCETASNLVRFLAHVQRLGAGSRNSMGALPGSYPIWAPYAPLRYPCWATKYFLDLVLACEHAQAREIVPVAA